MTVMFYFVEDGLHVSCQKKLNEKGVCLFYFFDHHYRKNEKFSTFFFAEINLDAKYDSTKKKVLQKEPTVNSSRNSKKHMLR